MTNEPARVEEVSLWDSLGDLPAGAEELFGTEARASWAAAKATGDVVAPRPVVLGILAGGKLAAGLFGWVEPDDSPEAERDGTGAASRAKGAVSGEDASGTPTGPRVLSIRQLVIPPSQRGKGLGPKLVRRAAALARERGCGRVRSTAGWGCPDHLMLYERLRFKRAGSGDRPYLVSQAIVESPVT